MTDNRAEMSAAILNAILELNLSPDGEIYVDPDHAREALIMAMAAIIEAGPDMKTPRDMRSATHAIAAELLAKIKWMRATYEQTGRRIWDADIVRPN